MFKYSGAGNTFVVLDGRGKDVSSYRLPETVRDLCRENGTDGLMILLESEKSDFRMEFFNPDGSTGMMCGNGGRCIAAFAAGLGIRPESEGEYRFEAPDGIHSARILSTDGEVSMVRLKMAGPEGLRKVGDGWFIDTGTRHFVRFENDVEAVDVEREGKEIRWSKEFSPEGVNVNFVQRMPDGSITLRTFEKGVERETLACGTGAVASAFVTHRAEGGQTFFSSRVHARVADLLVEHSCEGTFLTGPAQCLGECGK